MKVMPSANDAPPIQREQDTTLGGRLRAVKLMLTSDDHATATAAFVGDQAVCSGGNFILSFVAARHLPTAEFGVFALLNLVGVFSLTVNNWLIRSSLSSVSQTSSSTQARSYTSSLVSLAAIFGLFPAAILCIAAAVLHHTSLCPALILCALSAQVQETLRRAAMAQGRYGIGVAGDAISYIGQAVVLIAALQLNVLSLASIFWIIGATSVASFLVQVRGMHLGRPTHIFQTAQACWAQGRWITLSGIILSPIVYGMPWLLELTRGQTQAGMLAGLLLILGLSNPIMFSSTWLILVRGQEAKYSQLSMLLKRVVPATLLISIPLFLYWTGVFFFPRRLLLLFLGSHWTHTQLAGSLQLVVVYYAVSYVAVCLEVMTDAREKSRSRVGIDIAVSLVMLTAGSFAALKGGLPGVVCIGILVHVLRSIAYSFILAKPLPAPSPLLAAHTVEQE